MDDTLDIKVLDKAWYMARFGYFTGKFSLTYLRSDPRWPHLMRWGLTRWLGRMLVVDIYEFRLNARDPLTWHLPDGTEIQPDRHFETDQGSVPHLLNWLITRGQFRAFYLHDPSYIHHGLFFRRKHILSGRSFAFLPVEATAPCDTFRFVALDRNQSDRLLGMGVGAVPDCGNAAQREAIYDAVNLFGRRYWET